MDSKPELGSTFTVTLPLGNEGRAPEVNAEVVHFGEFRLDRTAHKLFKQGTEMPLTGKEFRLLEFFVKRSGRALTRDSILNAVWGNDVLVTDRSVDRCVTTLRSKVEEDPRNPVLIQTIREIGYRFELPPS